MSPSSPSPSSSLPAFLAALLSALCAGSVTVFSLYGHIFQERLHYSQFQVNGVASAASIACYLPVPLLGYLCDRVGPSPLSLLAGLLFCLGYGTAAFLYQRALHPLATGLLADWSYPLMLAAFVVIGVATCSMYLSAVTTCAKNFGRGRHRGLALAAPIAAYGLSGMWLSQLASRVLFDPQTQDIDVFAFFSFLAALLLLVGLVGALFLRVVDEAELIDEAADELERSGLLDPNGLFSPPPAAPDSLLHSPRLVPGASSGHTRSSYGTLSRADPFDGQHAATDDEESVLNQLLDPYKDNADLSDANSLLERIKKQWLLNAETRRFLADHTMWLFALSFFFMVGPGEAFINNMGTVIQSLQPGPGSLAPTTPATHVSIVALVSTAVRLLTGSLTDLLAPRPETQHPQGRRLSAVSTSTTPSFCLSRVSFLLFFAVTLFAGLALLASGLLQDRGDRFWIVSALVGAGYGAIFSLVPIIITVIWGVENFGTNWGIVAMFPALGATIWGLVYSAVYQAGAAADDSLICYGRRCYGPSFAAMAVSVWLACVLLLLAWRGRNGWAARGILI